VHIICDNATTKEAKMFSLLVGI